MKGNMPQQAVDSFRKALALNPLLWEAFEGLCTLGTRPALPIELRSFARRVVPRRERSPAAATTPFAHG